MTDINVYFFWPGLILSLILSILLTIGLNLYIQKRARTGDGFIVDENPYENDVASNPEDDFRTKTGGMIMIGPIPIIFGNGGFRFDKNAFKYALAFFLIVLIAWILLSRIVRL